MKCGHRLDCAVHSIYGNYCNKWACLHLETLSIHQLQINEVNCANIDMIDWQRNSFAATQNPRIPQAMGVHEQVASPQWQQSVALGVIFRTWFEAVKPFL